MLHPVSRVALSCLLLVVPPPVRGAAAQAEGPRAVVDGFIHAWNSHDMKAFGELFTEDADFVNVVGKWWKGRARIQAEHERSHATRFKGTTLVETNTTVRRPTWSPDADTLAHGLRLNDRLVKACAALGKVR